MNEKKDEKWLDELISRTINSGKPEFDDEKWKQKYPEEFQMLKSRAAQRPLTPSARRHPILTYGVNYHTCKRVGRVVCKSTITKLAAAAIIIIAIGLFAVHRRPVERIEPPEIPEVTKSPAEMMTAMSLNIAYRKGGMEAVEKQCEKAFEMLRPQPAKVSIQELLAEFNGNGKRQKGRDYENN